jgi:hypothetical protein
MMLDFYFLNCAYRFRVQRVSVTLKFYLLNCAYRFGVQRISVMLKFYLLNCWQTQIVRTGFGFRGSR